VLFRRHRAQLQHTRPRPPHQTARPQQAAWRTQRAVAPPLTSTRMACPRCCRATGEPGALMAVAGTPCARPYGCFGGCAWRPHTGQSQRACEVLRRAAPELAPGCWLSAVLQPPAHRVARRTPARFAPTPAARCTLDTHPLHRRWAAEQLERDPDFFNRLVGQQNPEYLWIGCSDSRVPVRGMRCCADAPLLCWCVHVASCSVHGG
jgi:hypothetical protein